MGEEDLDRGVEIVHVLCDPGGRAAHDGRPAGSESALARSATGGKYVTRYFEENAKKYRDSPDKTGQRGGDGWGSAERCGRDKSSDVCVRAGTDVGKNIWVNWAIRLIGADLVPDERLPCCRGANLPGGAASCAPIKK
ncbi:hypothetical protein [Burkholderia sp. A2]|uniref:hypothetical protein n=1 Tax=Burkholderia sp. A2 TaxID=236253 RepID=UPI00114D17DB|nr:hypothetical protein [Burkholderia sp. A2]